MIQGKTDSVSILMETTFRKDGELQSKSLVNNSRPHRKANAEGDPRHPRTLVSERSAPESNVVQTGLLDVHTSPCLTLIGSCHFQSLPQIIEVLRDLPADTVIDGEVVALDESKRRDFHRLQHFTAEASRIRYLSAIC